MKQFDVFKNTGRNKKIIPFVISLQSDLLSSVLGTTVVAPMYNFDEITSPVLRLHVQVSLKRKKYLVIIEELASVNKSFLRKPICNLNSSYGDNLRNSLDILFFNYP